MADAALSMPRLRSAPIYDRPSDDWYVDPLWCTELLLKEERFIGAVFDPCAGGGNVVMACRAAGLVADGSDIDPKAEWMPRQNFLATGGKCSNIIFNPPYNQAEAFIRHALECVTHKVAALVQQQFPFSQARHSLFTETPIARLYYLSSRPSMPPGRMLRDGEIQAKGGKTDYLWMVWDKSWRGPPQAFWLKREGK